MSLLSAILLGFSPLVLAPLLTVLVLPLARRSISQELRSLVLLIPLMLPTLWGLGTVTHQLERGLSLPLALLVALLSLPFILALTKTRCPRSLEASALAQERLARAVKGSSKLRDFAGRVHAVKSSTPCCTAGIRPNIFCSEDLILELDEDALEAVLLHEVEHLKRRDPLVFSFILASKRLNLLGSLLDPTISQWRLSRELSCDSAAVRAGASSVSLAETLVRVARPQANLVGFASSDLRALRLRVHILLDGPSACGSSQSIVLLPGLAMIAFLLPHLLNSWPL